MDELLNSRLTMNGSKYKSSLERIIAKYSKLHYQDGALEVDLGETNCETLRQYMRQSKAELTQLESKSLTDLSEESMTAQDVSKGSQSDVSYEGGGADETCVSTSRAPLEDNGWSNSDSTALTISSLDENQSVSEMDVQPEDQDQELEMSLRSHSGSLVELYPDMISRIGKAWRRQHVFEAADTVLRRYRRWRRHTGRSSLGTTFIVQMRHRNPNHEADRTLSEESRSSPGKGQCVGGETAHWSPSRTLSPRGTRRELHQPVLVMDFSGPSEPFEPRESSLNETFTVSHAFQLGEPPSFRLGEPPSLGPGEPPTFRLGEPPSFRLGEPPSFRLGEPPSACTARPCHPGPPRSRRLPLNAHSLQADVCSTYATETSKERSDFYGSPVRQSPAWAGAGLGRSPHGFSRSPKRSSSESRLISTPPWKPAVPPADAQSWLHSQAGRLSFDPSLPPAPVSYSPKKLDEDFLKLYHKFVCQSRSSSFSGLPCRFCARNSEAGGAASSSALAALALSPHRSLLRKRHRELDRDAHPQSKRYRDEHCPSSPGSKRYGREMLRRRLLQPQHAAGPPAVCHKLSLRRRSADAHQ
ncbi:uncharacterized protein si:dkeyp-117h8.4 [Pungitius pungitius]|uniref:uncharacterized protein si:dkeyp-117h8.4 n=1 Tax=Pungitius pungitius TaxID=134920 RepID=UPI002E0FB4DE